MRTIKLQSLALGAALLAVGLAACGGGGNTTPAVIPCVLPSGEQISLAYPIPGATGVPDSPGQIILAESVALPNSWQIILSLANGSAANAEGVVLTAASPLPTPFATPAFANPIYQSSALTSGLASATTLIVLLNNQASNCNGLINLGQFTTQ
jgi:hypothetical protein